MRGFRDFVVSSLVGGLLVLVPLYLAILLLLKAAKSLAGLVKPIAGLLPDGVPGDRLLSLLLVLLVCFLVGASLRTRIGRRTRARVERSVFERVPGYNLLRSLTQQVAGEGDERVWKPALVEIEDALVPGFIIEEFEDGRYTIFVPSVPTPFAGAVYVLGPERVHPLDVPFTVAIKSISRWGAGCRDLVGTLSPSREASPASTLT